MSIVYVLALVMTVLAVLPVVWVACGTPKSGSLWPLDLGIGFALVGFLFWAAPWALLSAYLRFPVLGLFLLACFRVLRRLPRGGAKEGAHARRRGGLAVRWSLLGILVVLDALVLQGSLRPGRAVDVAFPLPEGTYAVLQGGNSVLTNGFHRQATGDRYAVDLIKVNVLGTRARGLRPTRLEAYWIYGTPVLSPCSGLVVGERDGLRDNAPGVADTEQPAGNHLVIRCGRAGILLAHLQCGSVRVSRGEVVHQGQLVGRVGNSGNTIEPHLHVSAVADDPTTSTRRRSAIPLSFGGRWLSLNSVYVVESSGERGLSNLGILPTR